MIKKCISCGELKEHHAKGFCYPCYKKLFWKPKIITCKRCKRRMPHHGKGLCPGCFNFVFYSDQNKNWSRMKKYNISPEIYKEITQECVVCGFNQIVDLHHLDENNKNNELNNLIGLCPNHHKMLHDFRYKKGMLDSIKMKGYSIPEDEKINFVHKST